MSRLKHLIIPLLAFALFLAASSATPAHATNYTFNNGYYWSNGQAYTRAYVSYYDSYGCRRYGYRYTAVKVITSQTPNWRSELLQLKAARDKWTASIEASANEQNEFIEVVRELGLNGGYGDSRISLATINRSNPYAIQGGYGGGYSQLSAAQGSTHYGYSSNNFSVADVYGNVDLGALYNSAIRLASDSNQYGSKATTGAMTLVDQLGNRAASLMDRAIAVEEIKAKSAGIVQVSQALSQSIRAEARAYVAHGEAGGGNGQPPEPDAALQAAIQNGTLSNIADVIHYRCATCHKPGGKAEQFDLTDLSTVDADDASKILARTTTSDPQKRMPPEKPLSLQELRLVLAAAAGANGEGDQQGQQPAKQD